MTQMAMKAGTTGWMLETAFKKAIQVGKRVRKETSINERSVSVGSAAVDLAEEILGELKGKSVLVIGAGETGELISRALLMPGDRIAGGHQPHLQLSGLSGGEPGRRGGAIR